MPAANSANSAASRKPLAAVALAGDHHLEAAPHHGPFGEGEAAAAGQPQVGEVLQPLAEVVAHPGRGDLVHRDPVPQGQGLREGQILAMDLPLDLGRVLGEEEHAARHLDAVHRHSYRMA